MFIYIKGATFRSFDTFQNFLKLKFQFEITFIKITKSDIMHKILIILQIFTLIFVVGCTSEAEYIGDLEDGKPHGKGTITYENGDIYDGEWREGLKEGKGIMTSYEGGKYEGDWKNDKMEGVGTYIWPNGNKYKGKWKDGKKNGEGVLIFKDGGKMQGQFRDDKPWQTILSD